MQHASALLLGAAMLVLAACGPVEGPDTLPDDRDPRESAGFSYVGGTLSWHAHVDKPTPCHTVRVEERAVQIAIDLTVESPQDPDTVCAQVIAPENVTGEIALAEPPGSVMVRLDGRTVASGRVR